jgi:transposase
MGLDVGDRESEFCAVDEAGRALERKRVRTTPAAIGEHFAARRRGRVALEAGTHSPWLAPLLGRLGFEVIVANPRRLRVISENGSKSDRTDAELLARLARVDPTLLAPITPKAEELRPVQAILRARDALVRSRTMLVNEVRAAAKAAGARVPQCSTEAFARVAGEALERPLRAMLAGVLAAISSLTENIRAYDRKVERLCETRFPAARLLQTIPGVGPLTALAYIVAVGDPARFRKSRTVGSYFGLRPRRDESGESAPELRITKQGDGFVRRLLVQASQCLLARGRDCAIKRWGAALASRGKKNAKKRAIIAVARKLAVVMHSLWVSGETFREFPSNGSTGGVKHG